MQQTDKYKLNKPGVDDPITPVPLNENMDKIEAALLTKADAADVTDLDQRLQVFEAKKFAMGRYRGTGSGKLFVELPFTPTMVFVHLVNIGYSSLSIAGSESSDVTLAEGGFYASSNNSMSANYPNPINYIAFA